MNIKCLTALLVCSTAASILSIFWTEPAQARFLWRLTGFSTEDSNEVFFFDVDNDVVIAELEEGFYPDLVSNISLGLETKAGDFLYFADTGDLTISPITSLVSSIQSDFPPSGFDGRQYTIDFNAIKKAEIALLAVGDPIKNGEIDFDIINPYSGPNESFSGRFTFGLAENPSLSDELEVSFFDALGIIEFFHGSDFTSETYTFNIAATSDDDSQEIPESNPARGVVALAFLGSLVLLNKRLQKTVVF